MREPLLRMIAMKRSDVTEAVGSPADLEDLKKSARYVADLITSANDVLTANRGAIDKFKSDLVAGSIPELVTGLNKLRLTKARRDFKVEALFSDLKDINGRLKAAEIAKKDARQKLTGLCSQPWCNIEKT